MLRWLVRKIVQYAIDELCESRKLKLILSEIKFNPDAVSFVPSSTVDKNDVEYIDINNSAKNIVEAFSKSSMSKETSISGDFSLSGKVVKSNNAKDMVNLLSNIGD